MTVRNNHTSSPATVSISLYTDDGRVLDSRTYVGLPRRATWTFSVREALLEFLNQPEYVGVFHGSAIVHANQDVSVTVMHIHQSSPYATGSYTGLTASGPMLYFPLLQRANNSMYSDLTLFNPGTTSAQVQVQYIPEKAPYWGCTATSISIPANGSRNFNSRDGTLGCTLSSPFVGGATVTSNQPLVGVANQWRDVGPDGSIEAFMSYEAFPAGGTSGFMPILQRNNNNWYTSSTLLDTSEGSETATLYYYSEDNGVSCGSYPTWLDSNDVVVVFPSPPGGVCGDTTTKFVGAGRAFRNLALAMVVNQEELSTGNQKMSYSAVGGGTGTVIVPWVMKNHDNWQGRNDWYTGLNVQNLGTGPATVTVTYYNSDGSAGPAPDTVAALPARTNHVFLPAPSGGWTFSGSAVVTANQPIAVVVNHFAASGADDTFMSHTGLNR